ncbi:MAG: sugar phosphate isomerase/epimerase [Pontimonas sp.]|nr:sugar phosphate isomerase/epimerase [Pontimonas sp.]
MDSTAVFPTLSARESALKIFGLGISSVELSGGPWDPNNARSLAELGRRGSFRLHNYFPSYENPFVLNLASADEEVLNRSVRHVQRLIAMAASYGQAEVSVHAGFRIDPLPNLLGQRIPKQTIASTKDSMSTFRRSTALLADEASKLGVRLLLENNPCSLVHLDEFGESPFLLSKPEELLSFVDDFGGEVGLLLDVGHLKISANAFGGDAASILREVSGLVEGYHLSDNDGISDSNLPFDRTAWFWDGLSALVGYVSIESIPRSDGELMQMYEACVQKFGAVRDG